jgi:hypothetical protein
VVLSSLIYLRPLIRQPITVLGAQGKGQPSANVPFNADVVGHWIQDASGHHISDQQLFGQATATNGGALPTQAQYHAYLTQHHFTQWVSYRPNDWFWHFQLLEASGYAIAAVLLAAVTVLMVRRRTV